MEDELRVYLDHLIPRQSLRYRRSDERMEYDTSQPQYLTLRMSDLIGDHTSSRISFLRKPDFQRATWSWTADDCVSLLESVVNEQVIPSIIMWTSPESNLDYILDGGHRISVVLAWLRDNWGDKSLPPYIDEEQEIAITKAASRVRQLIAQRVGDIEDYRKAEEEFDRIVNEGEAPKQKLHPKTFERAQFYRKFRRGNISFPILWVTGDYEKAEQSFLKINKTGRKISDWETKLIENRNSSFARLIMSIANIDSARYYWPSEAPEGTNKEELRKKIETIARGVELLHKMLFQPTYESPAKSRRLQQPLLVAPSTEWKPYYLAELFTIIKGGKGQETETEKLLEKDKTVVPENLIINGEKLVGDISVALNHLIGSSPRSLALVPLLYFYNDGGRYVRSLLYGLIYWLISGDEDTILTRKRLFSAYRGAFEQTLLTYKENIIRRIGRNIGSGPEVTYPTARYYQGLLELLIRHNGNTNSTFVKEHNELVDTLKIPDKNAINSQGTESKNRIFTDKQKSTAVLRSLFPSIPHCGICEGLLDLRGGLQHDHITKWSEGGATVAENDRLTHPFCNNNRDIIEEIKKGQQPLILPAFIDPDLATDVKQLKLFSIQDFEPQANK